MRGIMAVLVVGGIVWAAAGGAYGQDVAPLSALARMPIKEVTVFKDGHAFVLHEGAMPTDANGDVLMDYLPTPVLGTFWAYAADKGVKLTSVVASQRLVRVEATALSIQELLEGNIGADVVIRERPTGAKDDTGLKYDARIVGLPERSSDELDKIGPPNSGQHLPVKGSIILLKTADGLKALPTERVAEVTFKGKHNEKSANVEFRNLLRLRLEGGKKEQPAQVGMMYVQKGLRWIPGYHVAIDGKGEAVVKLEATLINELADLEDVSANLVIGVPTFAFEGQVDPISLQKQAASLGRYFERDSQMGQNFSNAIMSQAAAPARPAMPAEIAARPVDLGPEIAGGQRAEDLYMFSVKHVTLKKGQRMVLPVAEVTLKYRDVYTLDVPFAPPPEIRDRIGADRFSEIARALRAAKVMHKVRLTNSGKHPLTTAPALIVQDARVLAQGTMTYAAVGADVDLPVTTAVDIAVKKSETEVARVPNAATWEGNTYARADLEGLIRLINRKDKPVEVEVTRYVLGNATKADADGKIEMVNVLEDEEASDVGRPYWWGWYSWGYWWHHFNGLGRIQWTVKLEPGKPVELKYAWNYFWR
ncbi:MAG: hypothetical protein NTV86_10800 [Planctomycetota bacterium]|nr:hypothetical protein [Planctomycetota bacterium]